MSSIMRIVLTFVLLGLLTAAVGCAGSRHDLNKSIVLANARAYNAHDPQALLKTLAPNLRRRCQATPGITVASAGDFIAFAESDWAMFPDGTIEVERLVAEGDLVGAFGRFTGTQRRPMGPYPASNKRVDLEFGAIFRIIDGRIARIEVTWDNLTALTQLGHWPPSDRSSLRDSLIETDRRWEAAAQESDADRVAQFWTEDAVVYLASRPPVVGKTALREMVAANRANPVFSIRWQTRDCVIADSGDLGYTLGPYQLTVPLPGGEVTRQDGNSICVWRRENEEWRCSLEVHAAFPANAPAATASTSGPQRAPFELEIAPGDAQLDANAAAVRDLISDTLSLVWRVRPVTDVHIAISAGSRVIPEVGLGAWSMGGERINIVIDTTRDPWLEGAHVFLPLALTHELAHIIRLRHFLGTFDPMGPAPSPDDVHAFTSWMKGRPPTLGEFVINEGLADHFALEIFSGQELPWDTALPDDQLEQWVNYVLEHWDDREYDRTAWVVGNDEIPRWASYSVGYHLVREHMRRNPDRRPSDLLIEPGHVFKP